MECPYCGKILAGGHFVGFYCLNPKCKAFWTKPTWKRYEGTIKHYLRLLIQKVRR